MSQDHLKATRWLWITPYSYTRIPKCKQKDNKNVQIQFTKLHADCNQDYHMLFLERFWHVLTTLQQQMKYSASQNQTKRVEPELFRCGFSY